ncbi:MAG: Smr/MutS family protein [Candidatus Krumholzibacteriia bacterium]
MGRFKARRKGQGGEGPPSKGMRRSIRFDAEQEWPEGRPPGRAPDAPPAILLRLLPLEEALHRLATQLRAYAGQGCGEVLVVHGKGSNSRGGVSVLGPAVREWCSRNVDVVASWREAPGKWGGAGAIVVTLR